MVLLLSFTSHGTVISAGRQVTDDSSAGEPSGEAVKTRMRIGLAGLAGLAG